MKNVVLLTFVMLFLGTTQTFARKRGIIPIGTTERIKVVQDFPNTEEYQGDNGRYLDLGVLYETFDVVWMPFWVTEDPKIVGLENLNTDEYYELDQQFVDEILTAHDLKKEELTKLSFWDKYLGLVVIGGLLIAYFTYNYLTFKEDEEEPEGE